MLNNKELQRECNHHINNARMLLSGVIDIINNDGIDGTIKSLNNENQKITDFTISTCESVIKHCEELIKEIKTGESK